MRNLIAAEWLKARTGAAWWSLALTGVLLGVMAGSGFAASAEKDLAAGLTTIEAATDETVRSWFTLLLFAALFTGVHVTREYASGTIGRSVLLSGGRSRLLAAKLTVGTAAGLLYALLAVACAAVSPGCSCPGPDTPRYGPVTPLSPCWVCSR
ncbi:hypothetical protein SHKM778_77880 [Streptomyces sp. KM77-8]|uniref:ABC transporter permease n=1 Tax=Streptomyces haneummycinicus TaxID=3074435 RepID=A0AAT9HW90_9ACTN